MAGSTGSVSDLSLEVEAHSVSLAQWQRLLKAQVAYAPRTAIALSQFGQFRPTLQVFFERGLQRLLFVVKLRNQYVIAGTGFE